MPRVLPFARRMLQTDVSTWSRERFSAVLLALLLASTWMVASAARAHADLRERYYSGLAVWRAKAPVPYDAPVAALRGLVAVPRANSLRVVVRADSVPERERNGMCRLAEEIGTGGSGGAEPVWIRLGPDIDPCVSRAAGGR
ncbi:MAG TPA: hypothetical protein VHG28_24555, partial [Longimicrobiaceae bacterium]|nr:hypothetical protein [Longimicrobiaceae bacterium]